MSPLELLWFRVRHPRQALCDWNLWVCAMHRRAEMEVEP